MSRRLVTAFLGAFVVAAIAVGCGGGDSSSSTGGGSASSKAAFVKQGDALCAKNNTAIAKEAESFTPGAGAKPAEVEDELVTEVYAPGVGRQANEIGGLTAPEGEEAEVEAIIEALEAGAAQAEEDPSSFGNGAFAESTKLARAYGFEVCGGE